MKSLLDDRRNQLKKYIGTDENNNKHVCAHLNTGPGFPTSNVVVPFFVFNDLKCEVNLVCLVNIGGIVDHLSLSFLFIFFFIDICNKS